jgi:uncharacterized Ntn-hydrolase superfamily protein
MTYSIVARDPKTGELGVAVQSHYFQVGPIVPWALPAVGAVATQSRAEPRYGSLGIELMASGYSAERALEALIAADDQPEIRQVGMVDAGGQAAAHTGTKCTPEAGHRTGDGYSVQANLMLRDTVWDAMAVAFEAATGPLAERMLTALVAAEAEGGDIRGRQSAAMLVVAGKPSGQSVIDRLIDLRVEDHPEPLDELARLLRLKRAYQAHNRGAEAHFKGDRAAAEAAEAEALRLAPELIEVRFWTGLRRAEREDWDAALELLAPILADPNWRRLLPRLSSIGRIKPELVTAIEDRLKTRAR